MTAEQQPAAKERLDSYAEQNAQQSVSEHDADCGSDACGIVRQSKPNAPIQPKMIVELAVEAAERIRTWRGIGLRVVLAEDFRIKPGLFVQVVA